MITRHSIFRKTSGTCDSDPPHSNRRLDLYDKAFGNRRRESLKILQLGVHKGESLRMWTSVFPKAEIVGVDTNCPELKDRRVTLHEGEQTDHRFLTQLGLKHAPTGFDLVIDNASHIGAKSLKSFWTIFPRFVKAGGAYSIEDWGTGYSEAWSDGGTPDHIGCPSIDVEVVQPGHGLGMVGFIKQLIDEVGLADITDAERGLPPTQQSLIERLEIAPGIAMAWRSEALPRW